MRKWVSYKNYNQKQDGSLGHSSGSFNQDTVTELDGSTDNKSLTVSTLPPYLSVYMWKRTR